MTVGTFRVVAAVEAVTWVAMLVAVVATRGFGVDAATAVVGPVHGIAFLVYLAGVLAVRRRLRWDGRHTIVVVVAALVPLGAWLIVERHLPTPPAAPDRP